MFNTTLKTELAARTAEVTEYKGLISALERSMAVVEFDLNGKVLRGHVAGGSVPCAGGSTWIGGAGSAFTPRPT